MVNRWRAAMLLAVLVGGRQPIGAAQPQAPVPPSLDERVAAIVKSEMLARGIPSVSVAVMRDGKMVLERAWGLADLDKTIKASTSTIYATGSVTKQFTAALVLKQVDRGRLSLTDPIGKHLAGLSPEVGAVTIEQLLNHTSGMKRSVNDPETRFEVMSAESLLAKATAGRLETKPGTTYAYSNAGYAVLGVLVERLYGKSYAAALRDEIAGPLELTHLSKCAEPKPAEATGYMLQAGSMPGPALGLHHTQNLGQGGICATAADLVTWTHALHTGRVLSPASYRAMITPRGAAAKSNYGFGLSLNPAAWGDPAILHGGQSVTGHVAELAWYPQQSVAVAFLYNVFPRVAGVSDLVARIVLGVPLPKKGSEPTPAGAAPAADTSTPAERTQLVGVYALAPQRTFEVTLENGELSVTPPGGSKQPLVFLSGNTYALGSRDSTTTVRFIIANGAATAFEANANGNKRTLKKIK